MFYEVLSQALCTFESDLPLAILKAAKDLKQLRKVKLDLVTHHKFCCFKHFLVVR